MATKKPLIIENGSIQRLQNVDSIDLNESITFGTKRHYRGIAPNPNTPVIGDTWEELDGTGDLIENWYFNGTYWLTLQTFSEKITVNAATASTLFDYGIDQTTNLFILNLFTLIRTSAIQNGTNFWTWSVLRVNTANTATSIGTQSTAVGLAANTNAVFTTAINTHVNVSVTGAKSLRLTYSRSTAGTGSFTGTIEVKYKKARI